MLAPKEQFQVSGGRCTPTQAACSGNSPTPRYMDVTAVRSWLVSVSKLLWFKPFTKEAKAKKAEPTMNRMVPLHGLEVEVIIQSKWGCTKHKDSKGVECLHLPKTKRARLARKSLCKTKTSGKKTVSNKKIGTKHLLSLVPSLSTSPKVLKSAL